jgi:hypothetical protein
MVLVQADRQRRIGLERGFDHLAQERLAGVLARAGARLQDHRGIAGFGGLQDGLHLLHVVDVESGHAVVVFGGVVE